MGQDTAKHNTKYPGVRYRNHPTRKAKVTSDLAAFHTMQRNVRVTFSLAK